VAEQVQMLQVQEVVDLVEALAGTKLLEQQLRNRKLLFLEQLLREFPLAQMAQQAREKMMGVKITGQAVAVVEQVAQVPRQLQMEL
jgi:predicted metalloprotease with PDZ domain